MTNLITRVAFGSALVSSVLFLAAPAHARPGGFDAEEHPGGFAARQRMNEALDLTETQREALQQARREAMASMREAREAGTDPAELRREHFQRMRDIHEDILTDEQLSKLDSLQEQRRAQHAERLVTALDLQPDQVEAVRSILADARPGHGGADAGDWQERRSALREQLAEVLTPEQMQRLKAMRSERREQPAPRRRQDRAGS